MQLRLVIWQSPLLNKANLKERKKKTICHVRVLNLENQKMHVLSSNRDIQVDLSSCQWHQCIDYMNLTVTFRAMTQLAHNWQKYVVNLSGLAWGRLDTVWTEKCVARLALMFAQVFPFSSPWSTVLCFCSFSCDFQQDLWDESEQHYLMLTEIPITDTAEDTQLFSTWKPFTEMQENRGVMGATYWSTRSSQRCGRGLLYSERVKHAYLNILRKIFCSHLYLQPALKTNKQTKGKPKHFKKKSGYSFDFKIKKPSNSSDD